ncbi:MAG: hypothetical protein ACO1QB_19385, partial [Verrucomicrobiales bacterium]
MMKQLARTFSLCALFVAPALLCCLDTIAQTNTRLPAPAHTLPANPNNTNFVYELQDAFPNSSFMSPVNVVAPPGETNRLFILERIGRLLEVADLNDPQPRVALDIRSRVSSDWDGGKVEGLTGLAFHPQFKQNGYFFVCYTTIAKT